MISLLAAVALASQAAPGAERPASSEECARPRSQAASIEAIMAEPSQYEGKCVTVRAISNGYLLFTSVEGYYRAGPLVGGDPAANPDDRNRLGLDNPKLLAKIPKGRLREVTATGRVQDCETARDLLLASSRPGDLVMVGGFCHYANGPYLWLKRVKAGKPLSVVRLSGEDMRAKVGDLAFAPIDWRFRTYVAENAQRYLKALRNDDRADFRELHLEAEKPQWQPSAVQLAFGDHPGFLALRRSKDTPQMIILVPREERRQVKGSNVETLEGKGGDAGDYSSIICFCTKGDCSGRWPISTIDADNREDRPYVCTELGPYVVFRRGTFPAFSTERGRHGLPETRQTN